MYSASILEEMISEGPSFDAGNHTGSSCSPNSLDPGIVNGVEPGVEQGWSQRWSRGRAGAEPEVEQGWGRGEAGWGRVGQGWSQGWSSCTVTPTQAHSTN